MNREIEPLVTSFEKSPRSSASQDEIVLALRRAELLQHVRLTDSHSKSEVY